MGKEAMVTPPAAEKPAEVVEAPQTVRHERQEIPVNDLWEHVSAAQGEAGLVKAFGTADRAEYEAKMRQQKEAALEAAREEIAARPSVVEDATPVDTSPRHPAQVFSAEEVAQFKAAGAAKGGEKKSWWKIWE